MATARELSKKLYYIPKISRWNQGIGAELPEEYKKFWKEWKLTAPEPVHYIPKEGKYERKPDGTVIPVQNVPLPLLYPKELDEGIWGGEAVIRGFIKKGERKRRVVRYWVPQLKNTVVYSEILNKYMRTVVTDRTMKLIHENYGFDHYILKSRACDLRSLLALRLKREMLMSLADKTLYPDDTAKQNEVYVKYEKYLEPFTREEIEWYGLTYAEACRKLVRMKQANIADKPVPLKVIYRQNLIKMLEEEKQNILEESESGSSSWLSKINPFSNKESSSKTS